MTIFKEISKIGLIASPKSQKSVSIAGAAAGAQTGLSRSPAAAPAINTDFAEARSNLLDHGFTCSKVRTSWISKIETIFKQNQREAAFNLRLKF